MKQLNHLVKRSPPNETCFMLKKDILTKVPHSVKLHHKGHFILFASSTILARKRRQRILKKHKAFIVCLAVVYLLALSMNFMAALKYPDLDGEVGHLLISLVFLSLLLLYSFFGGKLYSRIMIVGVLGGIVCFAAQHYQGYLSTIGVFDAISAIHYPLYILYVAPLFGINLLFDTIPALYSLMISLLFFICFMISRIKRFHTHRI